MAECQEWAFLPRFGVGIPEKKCRWPPFAAHRKERQWQGPGDTQQTCCQQAARLLHLSATAEDTKSGKAEVGFEKQLLVRRKARPLSLMAERRL